MSDEPRQPNRPTPDRTPPLLGGNIAWYLFALGIAALVMISLMDTGGRVDLGYMDLVKLIEQGRRRGTPRPLSRSARDRPARSRSSATPT